MFGVLFESQRDRRRRRLQAIVIEEVDAHNLKKMNELLTYQELVIWRRENGFHRVAEGEESCFHGYRSLPPTPQEYYASLWCEVNALKDAISMPARTPWQKATEFVDGLKGKLPDWELAEIKRYLEKRCREEAVAQMTVTPVDTVQHCSPISKNSVPSSVVYFNLENNEDEMGAELEKLESPSAHTGLETPGQQCPPYGGIWEQGQTIANGVLTAGVDSSQGRRISSPKERVGTRAGTAMTPENSSNTIFRKASRKPGDKTPNEENKQFDPGGQGEKARLGTRLYSTFLSGGELGSSLLVFCLCFCLLLPLCVYLFFSQTIFLFR